MTIINHSERGFEELLSQYAESTNFQAILQIIFDRDQVIEDVLEDMLTKRNLTSGEGNQLDLIGKLVGEDRSPVPNPATFFGFANGAPNAGPFGDASGNPEGSAFYGFGDSTGDFALMSDPVYVTRIRNRAYNNTSETTVEDILEALRKITGFLEGDIDLQYSIPNPGEIQFLFNNTHLPLSTKALLVDESIIPRPLGVDMLLVDADGEFT